MTFWLTFLVSAIILRTSRAAFVPYDLDPQCLYAVCANVSIENYCDVPLLNPSRHIKYGVLVDVMKPVPPHSKESFFLRRLEWSRFGINGVFGYDIGDRKLILFINAPYLSRGNSIGVAITKRGYHGKVGRDFGNFTQASGVSDNLDAWKIEQALSTQRSIKIKAGDLNVFASIDATPISEVLIKVEQR